MIKYIKQLNDLYSAYDEASDIYKQLNALDEARRPTFLDESDAGVQAYLASLAAANDVKSITIRQAREWLIRNGKMADANTAVNAIVDPTEKAIVQNYWEFSQTFDLGHPVLAQLATTLGITNLQAVFNEASQL